MTVVKAAALKAAASVHLECNVDCRANVDFPSSTFKAPNILANTPL